MAWSALARTWNAERKMYHTLILRIEDTEQPGCLVRLYEGEIVVGECLAATPEMAVAQAVQLARAHLQDESITVQNLVWVQV